MASPPAVTVASGGAATSIPGSAERQIVSGGAYVPGIVTISGGPTSYLAGFGGTGVIQPTWTEELAQYVSFSVITDAAKMEWVLAGKSASFRILINGQLVTAQASSAVANDGLLNRILVDMSALPRAPRIVTVEFGAVTANLRGVQMLVTDMCMPGPKRGPRAILIGDSFSEGVGATDHTTSYVQTLSWLTGWDIWALAEGGTGYLQTNGAKTAARGHISDVTGNAPELVIWALGINDSSFTPTQIQAEATSLYALVAAALPGVPQLVLGPYWGTTGGGPTLSSTWIGIRGAIQAAAAAAGLPFADPMGTGYLYGTGHVGATTGVGPSDFLVNSADGTHPSQEGHDALARAIVATLGPALGG